MRYSRPTLLSLLALVIAAPAVVAQLARRARWRTHSFERT